MTFGNQFKRTRKLARRSMAMRYMTVEWLVQSREPGTGHWWSLGLWVSLLIGMGVGGSSCCDSVFGQTPNSLPSEAQLPRQGKKSIDLPGENQLPGSSAVGNELPGEDQLPSDDSGPTRTGPEQAGPEQAGPDAPQPADPIVTDPLGPFSPILRLGFDGHTGSIRTLDLSDGGQTLVSAGEDKEVHVWRRSALSETGWLHFRTLRWPVTRGPRGRIYAARLKRDLVAFAGHGTFGFNGEIRIVDVASNDLQQVLADEQQGHRQVVTSVAWSPEDTPRLASADVQGKLVLWAADPTTGLWRPKTLVQDDGENYGEPTAVALQLAERRAFVPVTFLGPDKVVVPRYVGVTKQTNPPGYVNWQLHCLDLKNPGQGAMLSEYEHAVHVRSLSASRDGGVLASCDRGDLSGGHVNLWRFDPTGTIQSTARFKPTCPPIFVDLDDTGKWLLVGTEAFGDLSARLQVWDVSQEQPRMLFEQTTPTYVSAGVIDSGKREVIVTQQNDLLVYGYDDSGRLQDGRRLTVPAKPIQDVAFHKQDGKYQVAIGWNRDAEEKQKLEAIFDFSDSKLLGQTPIDPQDYLQPQRLDQRWTIGMTNDSRFQLFEGDVARGILPLRVDRHGGPTAVCTLPAPAGGAQLPEAEREAGAVIVATEGRSNIYVYRADASDPPVLLRQFREHAGRVTALSTSADGRYLVSGSQDTTVALWNLQDLFTASPSVNRWGVEFEIQNGQLVAEQVREDGPLYFRGVREGDVLKQIEWVGYQGESFAESEPTKMRQRLLDLPFDLMPRLRFARRGRPGPDFQSYPAWRPLARLFIDREREWAFWTPAGYYDASFNGHQKFGWQINHKYVDRPIKYYRAAQFRKVLERPDIMRHLLEAGSLAAAMRKTVSQIGPAAGQGAIVNQIRSKPTIRLLSPNPGDTVEGESLIVEAEIRVPLGANLVPPKAFLSGVPAVSMQENPTNRVASDDVSSKPELTVAEIQQEQEKVNRFDEATKTFRWSFRVPRDPVLQLEIIAATESEAVERVLVKLDHKFGNRRRSKPRLHVIAIGVSQYQDPQIQSLDFAAKSADELVRLFQGYSGQTYLTTTNQLIGQDATRPLWRVFVRAAGETLSQTVSPDDLVIMYLCGHGIRDRRTNQWYFVTADAKFRDLMNDQYSDCIAFSDLAELSNLPCRKLVILDSCHSGAVQPLMRRDDLKSALRFLQDDLILTLTASEGDEEAAEQREKNLGRFTAALIDALRGAALESDTEPGTISLNEVFGYVQQRLANDSSPIGFSQHPTASPSYLLETLRLPLTPRASSASEDTVTPLP